jgi:acetyl-CoA acetyltransferase
MAGIGGPSPFEDLADTGFKYMRDELFGAAGITPSDLDVALLYDNFTDCPMRMIEDIGWCGKGEAKDWVKEDHMTLDGKMPMQTQGGLMNEGYCHGLNNALEALQQLWGEAEDLCPDWQSGKHTYDRSVCRQVRDPRIALHTGVVGKSAIILRRA